MNELYLLTISAASLGFIHTLFGPDHYLPFIVLSKARKWSQAKTLWITFASGVGHVGSSVLIGILGIALGISLNKLEAFEAGRGNMVGWMIVAFGFLYSIYGLFKFFNNGVHAHLPNFLKPKSIRNMNHAGEISEDKEKSKNLTPWILFLIFVFGPCEVLIPMLIFPAAEKSTMGIVLVSLVFGISTILTMLTVVYMGYRGLRIFKFKNKEKYLHLLAGLIILISGVGITFLGW
jgi:sulfite exporter TauE/SafE